MFSLKNKKVLISGGASGIGSASAWSFAHAGASVVILDRDEKMSRQVAAGIAGQGLSCKVILCDVSDAAEVTARLLEEFAEGKIDVLFNCAGISSIGKLEDCTAEELDRVFSVNVKGTFNTMKAVIRPMCDAGGGVILNMASIAASVGIPDRFAYSMTKGAVISMTLSVAKDYIGRGIRCNCLSPARVHTPFVDQYLAKAYPGNEASMFDKLSKTQPIGRMAEPEEVANLALYLCSDEASFITGSDIPIDGGFIRLNN